MSTLEGKSIATTYKDLLQVSNNNIGIDNTIRPIEDGEGTQSALALSTDTLEIRGSIIPSTNSTFDIGSAERKIRHLYLSNNSLYVGDLQFSNLDLQEVKNLRGGAYATSTQGALAETALQPGAFAFESLSDIPTTLAGYGIIDAATAAQGDAADTALIKASTALQPGGVSFTDDLTDRPTTIAGYGITDAFNGSFNNLANLPTSLGGYGIVDAATSAQGAKADSALQPGTNIPFSTVSDKPTSLGGYGIVDAATSAQGAKADSALQPNTNVHVNSMHVSGGMMYGPATMYIDPEAIGDNTGKLVILGDLQVDGVTTTVNSTTVSVSGKTIELAGGANDPAEVDGAGVTVAASDASMLYKVTTDSWNFNKTLTTTGNVGIGTANPSAPLHTSKTNEDGYNIFEGSLGGWVFGQVGTSYCQVGGLYGTHSGIAVNTSGHVGIGTTDPLGKLSIQSDNATGYAAHIVFNNTGGAKDFALGAGIHGSTNHGFGIIDRNTNDAFLYINDTGNVGIGTTNPQDKLQVNNIMRLHFSDSEYMRMGLITGAQSSWGIQVTDSADGNDNLILNPDSGNIGIGTTNPGAKLEIAQSDGNKGIRLNYIPSTYPNNYKSDIYHDGTGNLKIESWAGSASIAGDILLAPNGGNVGIGTTNPQGKLHIFDNTAGNGDLSALVLSNYDYGIGETGQSVSIEGRVKNDGGGDNGISKIVFGKDSDFSSVNERDGNISFHTMFGDNGTAAFQERMRISSAGNVGIGTTNPVRKFEVVGDSGLAIAEFKSDSHQADSFLYITNTATPVATEVGSSATLSLSLHNQTGGKISAISTGDYTSNGNSNCALAFSTALGNLAEERMRISSAGKVGIGTTTPIATLNIAGVTADTDAFTISRVEDNGIPLLRIFQDSTWQVGGVGQGSGIAHINTNNRNLAITTSDDGNLTEGLFINLGKVGIGTLSPEVDLHVRNKESHGQSTLKLQGNNTGGFCSAIIFTNSDQTDSGSISYNADDNYMRFNTGGLNTTTERLRIHNNGVISTNGITNPLGTVHFTKSGGGNSGRQLQYNTTFDSNETNGWCSLVNAGASTGATGVFQNNRSATIGTAANATYNTDMFGLLYLQKESGANTYLWVDNSQNWRTATSFTYAGSDAGGTVIGTQTSDERLKNISQEFDYGIEHVLQLQPITYTRKDDTDSVQRLGFGAQTTQQVIPEAVYDTGDCVDGYDTDPDDETKSVPKSDDTILAMEYVQLVPVLTKAIQQQQAMIDAQNQRIDTLEQRLQTLENK